MREDGDRIQPLTVEELIQQYSKEDKIDHLLQVDNFYGGSKRSGKKLIIAILLASLPILFTRGVLFFLLQFVRFKYAVSIMAFVYLLYVIKVFLLIVGNETERTNDYLKKVHSKYKKAGYLVQVKNIGDDGIVRDSNKADILIVCYNGSQNDATKFSRIKKFLDAVHRMDNVDLTILAQNDTKASVSFAKMYERIRNIKDKTVAMDVLKMFRNMNQLSLDESRVLRTVYVLTTPIYEVEGVRKSVEKLLPKDAYYICRIADKLEATQVLSYDLGVELDLEELVINSYKTGEVFKSRILGTKRFNNSSSQKEEAYYIRRL